MLKSCGYFLSQVFELEQDMDLNTIFIILGALTALIFTFHLIWTRRQNHSNIFNKKPKPQIKMFSPEKNITPHLTKTEERETFSPSLATLDESITSSPTREQNREDLSHITISLRDRGVFDLNAMTPEDVEKNLLADGANAIHSPVIREQIAKNLKKQKSEQASSIRPLKEQDTQTQAPMAEDTTDQSTLSTPIASPEISELPQPISPSEQDEDKETVQEEKNQVVKLYVVAPDKQCFYGEQLQQAFEKEGFFFGDKNIYHFNNEFNRASPTCFSIAHLEEDGTFNPSAMAGFRTFGLVLFMPLPVIHGNSKVNLVYMINSAKSLAQHLNGIVLTDKLSPFDEDAEVDYLAKLTH